MAMNFETALSLLKHGRFIAREGWNGKGMHLYLEEDLTFTMKHRDGDKIVDGKTRHYEPCIVMFTAHGKHQPGWLASQADMLAEDWTEVQP